MTPVGAVPDQLQSALLPGERATWWGRPDPSVNFTPGDAFMVPFSILWASFAVFWEVAVLTAGQSPTGGPPIFFPIFGAAFVAFGMYFVVGRFFVKRHLKQSTVYALTDQRVLVVRSNSTQEHPLAPPLSTRSSRGHLSATFWVVRPPYLFASPSVMYENSGLDLFVRWPRPIAFYDVADAKGLRAAVDAIPRGGRDGSESSTGPGQISSPPR